MSRSTPPRSSPTPKVDNPPGGNDSPRTPRGGRLRDRVSFFEQVWTSAGRSPSAEDDLLEDADARKSSPYRVPTHHRRSSSRASDSSFEESFERLVEEGELNGAKIVKFEKITVRKSVREISSSDATHDNDNVTVHQRALTESSRTPSEEHAFDSAYQSHSHGVHGSKSSSITSFTRFPSEESLSHRRCSSPRAQQGSLDLADDRPPSEWYAEYRNQSFQNVTARIEYVRSRSEYDAHIAEIKGTASSRPRDSSVVLKKKVILFFVDFERRLFERRDLLPTYRRKKKSISISDICFCELNAAGSKTIDYPHHLPQHLPYLSAAGREYPGVV